MKKFKEAIQVFGELLRVFFISLEFVAVLLCLVLFLSFPSIVKSFGERFIRHDELWKYLALVPAGLFGWAAKNCYSLLFPMKDSNALIAKWPDFWRLKMRAYIAILWIIFATIMALIAWAQAKIWSPSLVGIVYLSAILVAFISAATIWIAQVNIRQILEEGESNTSSSSPKT